ncbi:MAG: putative methyltransferase-domain-containing protein [Benjaminiella poitrasii]|nr:MAG: putative methyltransferase-domain-containing protein [Benjaminiella poitrasii]
MASLHLEAGPDDYYYSLQRYSILYRILLARPYITEIKFNTWNRIDLKLVNELGLTLTGNEKKRCRLEVGCHLLVEKEGAVVSSKECSITCRPIQHNAWESTDASDIAGFHNDTQGNFEYMVTLQDEDNSFLIIKEDWNMGTPGKMWDSALVISQLFCDKINTDPNCLDGCRLLDLSAGTGCVGLLIASMCKMKQQKATSILPKITMTDLEEALDMIYKNRAYNHLEKYTEVKVLKWGKYEDVQKVLEDGPIDTIIASDILYDPASFPKLVQTLDWLSREQTDIYLGYKRRGLDLQIEQSFFDICSEKFYIKLLDQSSSKSRRGWILNELSDICKDTGVNIYKLIRK